MKIQINTDHNIQCHASLVNKIRDTVESTLLHVKDKITQVEVYLSDENGKKPGPDDIRCVMEARIEGRPSIAVTEQASSVDQAVDGAVEKLTRLIDHTLERLRDQPHQPRLHEPYSSAKP